MNNSTWIASIKYALFSFFALALVACNKSVKSTSFESPRGTITLTETNDSHDPKNHQENVVFHELSNEDRTEIEKAASNSVAFIEQYVPASNRTGDVLDQLDLAFSAWLASTSPNKPSAAEVEKMVGAALGKYCIVQLGVKWMKVSDSYGNEFALVGQNPDTRFHPFASVRYRIEDRKTDFIGALFEALRQLRKPGAKKND